jgi:hypothetical protein
MLARSAGNPRLAPQGAPVFLLGPLHGGAQGVGFPQNVQAPKGAPVIACESQQKPPGYKGIIIGVTGNVNKEQIDEFMDHGADDVFPKPLNMEQLANTIHRLMLSH